MSVKFMDSNLVECTPEKAVFCRIEAFDVSDFTQSLLDIGGMNFKIDHSNISHYPVYFPPRYLCTLVRAKTKKKVDPKEPGGAQDGPEETP